MVIVQTRRDREGSRTHHGRERIRSPARLTSEPRFSVVIAVFNEADNLEAVTKDVLRATAPLGQFELIYVDDGSTDLTADRIRALRAAGEFNPPAAPRPALRQDSRPDHRYHGGSRALDRDDGWRRSRQRGRRAPPVGTRLGRRDALSVGCWDPYTPARFLVAAVCHQIREWSPSNAPS